ncbi:MAG: hypothetical protein L6413_05095, partial [Coriobacteriia bacterium]|nr:hypothetical protein [Coriobacteriia bacterium]
MDRLSQALTQFGEHLARFNAREPVQYSLSALRLNTDWPWGHAKGVYCFVRGGRIQYVGRAIGSSSIGARLWSHINSLSDPAWADVINDDGTTV